MTHIIQCTVVFELSLKDTHPYPNTLLIRSLPEVDFWVFHPRDLTSFLIHLTRTFIFHYYFIFLSFSISLLFIHKYHKYQIKFPLVQRSLKLQFIPKFHNFFTIPIIPIIKYNYFLHNKITKKNF